MNGIQLQHEVRGHRLRGIAFLPDPALGAHPTAVLQHGFGANRIEAGGLFVQLARALNASGIATVAFDRAGHGESDGDFFDSTVSTDVEDGVAMLSAISELEFVDATDLHLVGMSLGSVVASCVAADTKQPVRSLTLWSPAAVFVDDARRNDMGGRRPFDELRDRGWFDNNGVRLGPAFFDDARTFDVYGRPSRFGGPVRVISGGADPIVPDRYAELYRETYGPRADVTIVPGADHVWSSVPARERLIDDTVAFISGSTGPRQS